ncbi:MAG: LGFP repeat-containing protein, partial [Thermoleophilia bacterium]
ELKHESDAIINRTDLDQTQKQVAIAASGYNASVRQIVTDSRTQIEAQLTQAQVSQLPDWVTAQLQDQRGMATQTAVSASLNADGTATPQTAAAAGPYRVYATQYYSNFGPDSVDVAVPDKYVKFASLGWEYHAGYPADGDYSVNMTLNGRQLNGVQVKDCGPWNIDDNYWNSAGSSRPRRLYSGLSAGLPESQAAYYNDYNGGLDQFGRVVSNPAGIDLSPQAGVQLGLGYLVSGWIEVSFNWEGAAAPPPIPVIGGIKLRYDALGGAPGAPRNAEYDVAGGRAQDFAVGRLIWNRSSGQVSWIYGGIQSRYDALGGPNGFLRLPLGDEFDVPGGREVTFQGGRIYWSNTWGSATIYGATMAKYIASGGPAALGLPLADEEAVPGGRVVRLERGQVYWSGATGAHVICGGVLNKYIALGGAGSLGLPTSDEYAAHGGRVSDLQSGRIYWSATTGAHYVLGGILQKYDQLGGAGRIGLPTTDETGVSGTPGARMSEFTGGRIYWSAGTGSKAVWGAILAKYIQAGGHESFGIPVTDEQDVPGKPGARVNQFERSRIYWSSATGARPVYGGIMARYLALGGPAQLGLPTSDEYDVPGGRAADFEIGRLFWSPATDSHHVLGGVLQKFDQLGGAGSLGLPTTDETSVTGAPGARMNSFTQGEVYWNPTLGSHAVYGAIGIKYRAVGGPATLGLPISDESDATGVPSARYSSFEKGRIYWSAQTGAQMVYGGILDKYLSVGGCGSSLGLPLTDEFSVPGGRRSNFQGGYITWDANTGATSIVTY